MSRKSDVVPAIRRAIVVMRHEVGEQVEVQTFDLFCLIYLQPGSSMLRLAEHLDISLSGTSRNVEKLKKKGLVTRKEDTVDRRVKLISLTAKGERIVKRINTECIELLEVK